MRIALINTEDRGGGAAAMVAVLGRRLRERGHDVALVVGLKHSDLPWIREVPVPGTGTVAEKIVGRAMQALTRGRPAAARARTRRILQVAEWRSTVNQRRGREDFDLPGSARSLVGLPFVPDIIHAHNLHGFVGRTHFDLRALAGAGGNLLLTLHDAWAFTGHCAYFFGCERWRSQCGHCPDLGIYPSIRQDRTAGNLAAKAEIYRGMRVAIAGPSQWIVDCARESILQPALESCTVIPNGVDLEFFRPPADPVQARRLMGLAGDERAVAFIADLGRHTPFRDYAIVEELARTWRPRNGQDRLVVFEVGSGRSERLLGPARVIGTGVLDRAGVRRVLQASTALLHPARADNFPTVILEAMACGTPVIASRVGGIPEQVQDRVDGFLHPAGDLAAAQAALQFLIASEDGDAAFRSQARRSAELRFNENRMVDDYEALYRRIVEQRTALAPAEVVA